MDNNNATTDPSTVLRQTGFIIKGGGLNIDAWIAREKETNPKTIAKDFPNHVEFYIEEKKK